MSHPYAVFVSRLGGPEVLVAQEIDMPAPGPATLLVRQTAIGVNFADVYLRAGQPHSHNPTPPFIPGINAVGTVIGPAGGTDGFAVGDRVTYTNAGVGTYSSHVAVAAAHAIKVPASLDDVRVAAGYVRVLTAHYLLRQIRQLEPGAWVLVHAAAGGVGQILVQWAKRLGLHVIATVGSAAKERVAKELGADVVINYTTRQFVAEVQKATQNRGVSVVYDSVGRATFAGSLDCLEPKGLVINFGTASGQVEGFALQALHAKSLSICRPTLKTYIAQRSDLVAMASDAFELLTDPGLRVDVEAVMPLKDAELAHRKLESRTAQGSIVLIP